MPSNANRQFLDFEKPIKDLVDEIEKLKHTAEQKKIDYSGTIAQLEQGILDKINSRKKEIRHALGEKIGKQVRIIPELIFYIDEVEENAQRMDELIKNLHIPPADKKE